MRLLAAIFLFSPLFILAQNLPDEVRITSDGILKHGGEEVEGFYNIDDVHKLEITLTEPDWFRLMDGEQGGGGPGGGGPGGGGDDGELLVGTLTVNDDIVLDSVLVGIKGQTSDFRNNSEKKSFKIEIDPFIDQDLMGYDNLNLNCAFDDHSSMREVLFYDISRGFTQSLKGSFVELYINGEYWGPYNNIQQLEGTYIKEWFRNNDGTRWRARLTDDAPPTGGGGGPGGDPSRFGAGVATLNYNGADSTDYNVYYTLKSTDKDDPWTDLINVCEPLNNTPVEDLYEVLNPVLDIDRTLWMLAQEILASDDDGYFFKGGMDYYVYWDDYTQRLMPLEVDGNSVMSTSNVDWSPFFRADDDRFPLISRLLENEEVRQRYLAHLRTVLAEHYQVTAVHDRIDAFAEILDPLVIADPKKLYSHNQFIAGVQELKEYISDRISFLSANQEINRTGLVISDVTRVTQSGETNPQVDETVTVTAQSSEAADKFVLYYATGLDGQFERTEMLDDGMNMDAQAGDNIYTATIPGYSANTYVRYYIEGIKDDAFKTASYLPSHAEREVFLYQVQPLVVEGDVVINEFMASNSMSAADGSGAFPDWIELYNKGTQTIDLTGYYLSDDETEVDKWAFPDNTTIDSDGYLIIWADSDEDQTTETELHAGFKLSAGGESVILVNPNLEIEDQINYDEQQTDISFARIPNGTGDFLFRTATFSDNNDGSMSDTEEETTSSSFHIYPNPASESLFIDYESINQNEIVLTIHNAMGVMISAQELNGNGTFMVDVKDYAAGIYSISLKNNSKEIKTKKFVIFR